MQIPNDFTTLTQSVGAFAYASTTPAELQSKLQTVPGSAVDRLFSSIELLYAFRNQIGQSGLTLLGQCCGYANMHGWQVPGDPNRLTGIYTGCQRDLGEPGTYGPAADDPAPITNLRSDGLDWRSLITPTLAQAQQIKHDAVKALRTTKENGTCTTPSGVVQIDDTSKIKINGLATMAQIATANNQPFSVDFIMADNSVVTLDAAAAISMSVAVGTYISKLYANSVSLFGQISAAADVATVNAIDITTGWPT